MSGSVVVTGAAGGLGGAVVDRLVRDGWRVVAVVRSLDPAAAPDGGALAGGGSVLTVAADLADADQVAGVIARAREDGSAPLRAVVNLVGGYEAGGRVHETPIEAFEAQLRLNLRPSYLVAAAALPHLIAGGGGSMVFVGSRASQRPYPGAAGYITAKAGLLALVDALAVEYRGDRVRANAVLPSIIDTPANRAAMPTADPTTWVSPAQLADTIAFLCSDASAATSGAHIPVYGRA